MRKLLVTFAAGAALLAGSAQAAVLHYMAVLSGANEVAPVVGDPDGSGIANIYIDELTNQLSWIISVSNLEPTISGAHIHQGAAGVNGPVRIDFSATLSGGPISDSDIASLVLNPGGFYVNVHTRPTHPGGAIRGQVEFVGRIPEPATTAMLLAAAGLAGLGAARRRSSKG